MYNMHEKVRKRVIDEYEYKPVYSLDWSAVKQQWNYWDSFRKHAVSNVITGGMIGAMAGTTITVGILASVGLLAATAPMLGPFLFPCLIVAGIIAGILISNALRTYLDRRAIREESMTGYERISYPTYDTDSSNESQPLLISANESKIDQKIKHRTSHIRFSNNTERAFFERGNHKETKKQKTSIGKAGLTKRV